MSVHAIRKYHDHATLCIRCSARKLRPLADRVLDRLHPADCRCGNFSLNAVRAAILDAIKEETHQ
jgi:hypothetical protein